MWPICARERMWIYREWIGLTFYILFDIHFGEVLPSHSLGLVLCKVEKNAGQFNTKMYLVAIMWLRIIFLKLCRLSSQVYNDAVRHTEIVEQSYVQCHFRRRQLALFHVDSPFTFAGSTLSEASSHDVPDSGQSAVAGSNQIASPPTRSSRSSRLYGWPPTYGRAAGDRLPHTRRFPLFHRRSAKSTEYFHQFPTFYDSLYELWCNTKWKNRYDA